MSNQIIHRGLVLAAFALVSTGLISITFTSTQDQIEQQKVQKRLAILNEIVPTGSYNNDIQHDCAEFTSNELLGSDEPHKIYRGRMDSQPSAVAIETSAPNGYGGKIDLIVGISAQNIITGVRALQHKETPGLGDKIELRISEWIRVFTGKTVEQTEQSNWKVKKDGGQFDQFTGATITPRAVVSAVKNTAEFYKQHQANIYAAENICNQPISSNEDE